MLDMLEARVAFRPANISFMRKNLEQRRSRTVSAVDVLVAVRPTPERLADLLAAFRTLRHWIQCVVFLEVEENLFMLRKHYTQSESWAAEQRLHERLHRQFAATFRIASMFVMGFSRQQYLQRMLVLTGAPKPGVWVLRRLFHVIHHFNIAKPLNTLLREAGAERSSATF